MDDKQMIRDTLGDLVSNFLYYDRKEDEDLPRGVIEKMYSNGEITIDEMAEWFKDALTGYLES
jgi:hypothetical protein